LKTVNSRREQSTDDSLPFGVSPTKRPDAGLLSPELAAGIRRVMGAKKLGVRLGNWLTAEEARRLWQAPDPDTLKGKRDAQCLPFCLDAGSGDAVG